MKVIALVLGLLAAATAEIDFCYDDVVGACGTRATDLSGCNARYGAAHEVFSDLQRYVNQHVNDSFQYLLMATHFENYQKNRAGFHKLFQKMSDDTWEDAIDLIKYIGKRGGVMDFNNVKTREEDENSEPPTYELYELGSLAKALDQQKVLAEEAHNIHAEVSRKREAYHDPEVASFLEEHFVHKHADTIRDLAGYTNDLKRLLSENKQPSLAVFLFDEYLQSV